MVIEELLVIFACVNGTGCVETSGHYYNTHPAMKELVEGTERKAEQKAEELTGPVVVQVLAPAIYGLAGGTATVGLNKNFSLKGNKQDVKLMFNKEF